MALLGFFLSPYARGVIGFEPTSVELHQTGTFRMFYRLSYLAAAESSTLNAVDAKEKLRKESNP